MGWVHAREFDWPNAEKSFERALELNRTLTPISIDYRERPFGRSESWTRRTRSCRQAMRTDPLSLGLQREIAGLRLDVGRYEEAVDRLQRVRAVDPEIPLGGHATPESTDASQAGRRSVGPGCRIQDSATLVAMARPCLCQGRPPRRRGSVGRRASGLSLPPGDHPCRPWGHGPRLEALDQLALVEPHRVVDLALRIRNWPAFAATRGPRLSAEVPLARAPLALGNGGDGGNGFNTEKRRNGDERRDLWNQ